jgi:signal transduction histidine kinase
MTRNGVLAWLLASLAVAAIPAILFLDAAAEEYGEGWLANLLGAVAILASTGVGLLLALRRHTNPIGWFLLANAIVLALAGLAPAYAGYALEHPGSLPGGRAAAVWDTSGWPLLFAGVIAIAFVFPDGRLPSPRWRPWAIGGAASFLVMLLGGLLSDEPLDAPFEELAPFGVLPGAVHGTLQTVGLLGMGVTFVAAMLALVVRFRGAHGVLRSQLKWIAYAGVLIPVSILVGTLEGAGAPSWATWVALVAVEVAIPVAIGIAVLRYRLYEIDRLISATLVYAVLTAVLGAAFVAVALGLGVALGGGSAVPTAAATLAVAVAFRPVRARVQTQVDRRFNRSRYEGVRRVDRFLDDLRLGRAEPEEVGRVLGEATHDPSLELFYWLPRDNAHADAAGRIVDELPTHPAGCTPVRRAELQLATLVHAPDPERDLLDLLIGRAGLAIEIARLRVEVRRQLAEVESSRARIVAATYDERQRLERDLHDGAQQRLVSIGLDLRHLQHELGPAAAPAERELLDGAVTGLADAIAQLRELARGIRPATLDHGLAPALRELAARAPIPTEVEATDERFERDVEAAAYFVASEALTNAIKHARCSRVVVHAGRSDSRLVLTVSDDGRGGAAPTHGSGLAGLSDRVVALGGRLVVKSDADHGTSIVAELPCA